MNCPKCGFPVTVGDAYCDSCGADLSALAPVPVAPPADAAGPAQGGAKSVAPVAVEPVVAPGATPVPVPPAPVVPPPAPPAPSAQPEPPVSTPAQPGTATPQAPATPATGPVATGPRLVIKDTGAVCPLPVGRPVVIGRTDPNDGIYPDVDLTQHDTLTGVSRRHAQVHEQGGQWFIQDLGSTNYTVVNRQRLQPNVDFLIEPGDDIRFGRLAVIFQL